MALQLACQRFASVAEALADKAGCAFTDADDGDLIEASLDQASDMLYLLSGGRITGICTRTVRPYEDGCSNGVGINDYLAPVGWLKQFNGIPTIPLRGPGTDIVEIVVDGVVLNPSVYGLMNDRFLFMRTGSFPSSNNLLLDDSHVGTWSVTYRFGRTPDPITKAAAIEIAIELVNEAYGKKSNLPVGVTSANIQGASVTIQERSQALRDGGSQLPKLSRFIGIYAPDGAPRSGVYSPELRHGWELMEVEGPSGS